MRSFPLLAALFISAAQILTYTTLTRATLQVDFIDFEGLKYFKANNLTNPGVAEPALNDLKARAKKALGKQKSYTVVNGNQIPPDGNREQYYSWAPYFSVDCNGVNPVKDEMVDCPYVRKDGKYSKDLNKLTTPGESSTMMRDVLYLSLYYYLYEDEAYAAKAVSILNTWFLDSKTAMVPSVEFGQVVRGPPGPKEWKGRREGILDMRYYVYIPASVDMLSQSKAGNPKFVADMKGWFSRYSNWLISSKLGSGARNAANNHATFYVAQLSTYLAWTGQQKRSTMLIQAFIDRQFQRQIAANGDQPLESGRTRPVHYLAFNLIAMTYVARLSEKTNGPDLWNMKNKNGGSIKAAIDYVVDLGVPKNENPMFFLVPLYAAKMKFGDPTGKYTKYLDKLFEIGAASGEYFLMWSPTLLADTPIKPKSAVTNATSDDTDDGDNEYFMDDGGGFDVDETPDLINWDTSSGPRNAVSSIWNQLAWGLILACICGYVPLF